MTVVVLDVSQAGEVLTLQRAAFAYDACVRFPGYTAPVTQTLDELREEMSSADCVALGIREDGRLIAAVRMRRVSPDAVFLARLCVAPDRWGEGIAGSLMSAVDDAVREHFPGVTRIEMSADGENTEVVSWYERLGFTITARGTANSEYEWELAREL